MSVVRLGHALTVAALFVLIAGLSAIAGGLLTLPLLAQPRGRAESIALVERPQPRVQPITDPTQLRRLALADLKYAGAFRLPATEVNGDSFISGGGPITFNDARNSLFVAARSGRVAEISVPAPSSAPLAELPVAEFLQFFADPAEGGIKEIAKEGAALAGLLAYGNRLYGSGLIYYDAANVQRLSHFARPLALSEKGASPMRAVWEVKRSGFVAGYLATVPPEWQSRLGGPAVTGQCCVPIIWRTSLGPAAFVFNPADLDDQREVEARPLVYYPNDHPSLGGYSGSSETFGATTEVTGVAFVAGTRTALFIGRNGLGPYCYGEGTTDKSLDRERRNGAVQCYDPANEYKGPHAYPYRYQVWAYDLNDLAEVRAGRRDPWSVKPYGVWPLELPVAEHSVRLYGVAYDARGKRLFISQRNADKGPYNSRALIHVFQLP